MTRWTEFDWKLGSIALGILGFVLVFVALSMGSLLGALLGVVLCLGGFARAVYFIGRYP